MVDIYNAKLLDLLPPNLQQDPDMIAASKSIDKSFLEVVEESKKCILLPNIDNLESDVVDLLAWRQHVDFYNTSFDLAIRRELVKKSIPWHRRKGTSSVVEELVSTFFKNSKIEEWFEYGGDPYYFRIVLNYSLDDEIKTNNIQKKWSQNNRYLDGSWTLDGSHMLDGGEIYEVIQPESNKSNPLEQNNLMDGLNLVKNKRSWLDEILYYLTGSFRENEIFTNLVFTCRTFIEFYKTRYLLLDGTWFLDGEYLLDGYKKYIGDLISIKNINKFFIDKTEIFTPSILSYLKDDAKNFQITSNPTVINKTESVLKSTQKLDNKLKFFIDKPVKQFVVRATGNSYLNGEHLLDGSWLLNGKAIETS
ncbi:phage tail protein I [Clostridium sp. JS66]|uniref:phage tail protein I n=1 Tax=Clostridium sp. JS66 TaxID=3064705 RepID=UPI00298E0C03|nr:phage tail protein I [Clostridium sp. JS66]WPC41219.1 phage tail protein I [Clostridium sp. JS66]